MSIAEASLVAALRERTPRMVAQLEALVAVESGSSDPDGLGACAAVVERLASEVLGSPPERVEADGQAHLVWRNGREHPSILLVGHLDTVWPRGTLERWPFFVRGDRAGGPGAFDMKAGIVQMLHGLDVAGDLEGVAWVLTCDEELGSPTSRALVEGLAEGASAALVLEPSADGCLKISRKGTSMYELVVEGRAAHAGLEPEKGANATVEVAHQVLALGALARPGVGTTVTPTVISGGTTTNTVPAHASLHVDVRAESPDEQERVDAEIRALRPAIGGTRLVVTGGTNRPPFPAASSRRLFEVAQEVATSLGLAPLKGVAVGGGSDGNFTAGIGTPTLDGLGAVGGNAHAEGEWVSVAAMAERAALVGGLVRALQARLP